MHSSFLWSGKGQEVKITPHEKAAPPAPSAVCGRQKDKHPSLLGKKDSGFNIIDCVLEGGSGYGFPKSDVFLLIT